MKDESNKENLFRRRFAEMHENGWAVYSLITAALIMAAFILAAIGFKQVPGFVNYAGIFQRISIIAGCVWIFLVSVHFTRKYLPQLPFT